MTFHIHSLILLKHFLDSDLSRSVVFPHNIVLSSVESEGDFLLGIFSVKPLCLEFSSKPLDTHFASFDANPF